MSTTRQARQEARAALGARAESLVCRHLEDAGYRIVARNVRVGRKEIDIIARRRRLLVFCEVRARATGAFLSPLETIDARKAAHVREAARAWMMENGRRGEAMRFDAAGVTFDRPEGEIDYREDAF